MRQAFPQRFCSGLNYDGFVQGCISKKSKLAIDTVLHVIIIDTNTETVFPIDISINKQYICSVYCHFYKHSFCQIAENALTKSVPFMAVLHACNVL